MSRTAARGSTTGPALIRIALDLRFAVEGLRFGPPVTHVYNPLRYAWKAHRRYLERYGGGRRRVLLIGMNPGPWGMAQTGVPFGDVEMVDSWLGIREEIQRPRSEHPRRLVEGFECHRREISGQRLWGWARDTFGTPARFFRTFFVYNYCPLSFLEESGRNRTPDRLGSREREALFSPCDRALARVIRNFRPSHVFGLGRFAEQRIRAVAGDRDIRIGSLLHPSPASPQANRDWRGPVEASLQAAGIRW